MLELLIFTHHRFAYAPKRFKTEAELQNFDAQIMSYKKVDLNNLPGAKFVILREPDARKNIYDLRDLILNFYVENTSNVLNKDSYLKWSVLDKKTQHLEFKNGGISAVSDVDPTTTNYPFIVKSKLGSHGDSVYKIESSEDLETILKKYKKEDLLFQEFQTSGFDLRVIVLGSRVLGIMKRIPKEGEFLSNFSQGGFVEIYNGDDTDEIQDIALKTAKHFKLDYVGVDLMRGNDGEWKVLEVNRACQFKGFEEATGINVASEVINFLTK